VIQYSYSDGILYMPAISTPGGDTVRLHESYTDDEGARLFVGHEFADISLPLTLPQIQEIRDQCDFLLKWHRSVRGTGPIEDGVEVPYAEDL